MFWNTFEIPLYLLQLHISVKNKPLIPPDLHDVSPENNLENDNLKKFLFYCCPNVNFNFIPLKTLLNMHQTNIQSLLSVWKNFLSSVANQNTKKMKNEEEFVARNVSGKRIIVNSVNPSKILLEISGSKSCCPERFPS